MADIIQQRRDTAANWTTANPILASGEIGLETDTKKFKFGDGTTAWNSLPYASVTADVAAAIVAAAAKPTPVDADTFGIVDSAAGNVLKKLSWANIKATLLTYFNTIYEPIFSKGNLVQGSNVTLTGTLTGRLVGTGDVTIAANSAISLASITRTDTVRIDNLVLNADTSIVYLTGLCGSISGMNAGGINRKIVFVNNSGDFINLDNDSINSSAGNRFGFSFGLGSGAAAEVIYNTTFAKWLKIGN